MVDKCSARITRWQDPQSADALGQYHGQWGPLMLDSWTSDTFFYPAFTCVTFSLTAASLTNNHSWVSSSSHTQKDLSIFWGRGNFHTQRNAGHNAPPDLGLPLSILSHYNGTWPQKSSFPSNLSNFSTFPNRDSSFLSFINVLRIFNSAYITLFRHH